MSGFKTVLVDAILFDMDGTLIDSTPGVLKAWDVFARDCSFNAAEAAAAAHGRRLCDTIKEWCHIDDEEKLQAEVIRFEETVAEGGVAVLPGTLTLLNRLASQTTFGWTIVTSATNTFTYRALQQCSIPVPPAGCVTSNDVQRGKPHPDPYFAGAKKCSVDPTNCLVVEDSPSGLRAGCAAGAKTLAVRTSHTLQAIQDAGVNPDFIIRDLTKLSTRWVNGKVEVTIDESE